MEPRVLGRGIAAAADPPGGLTAPAGRDRYPAPMASRFDLVPSSRMVRKWPVYSVRLWK